MAVRCPGCGRLSRDESVCEWCRFEIPPETRRPASTTGRHPEGEDPPELKSASGAGEGPGEVSSLAVQTPTVREASETDAEAISRREAEAAAAVLTEEDREEETAAAAVDPAVMVEAVEVRQDRDTLVILALILVQLVLTLYLGRLSSWWSVTGLLWLLVGYGVWVRASWSLALPLVLFTLDVALLLFGVGPRERAGFPALAPMDFLLYLLRLVIWGLIWRLRDEMA